MDIQLSITKDEINQLPRYQFDGEIVLIESKEDALKAIDQLKNEPVLGFDTETKAAFKKGERYDVALVQLATETHAYLFRISRFSMIQELADILADPNIIKTGVAIVDDVKGLKKLCPFDDSGFIDLADIAKQKKILNFGLRALTAICLQKKLSKNAKISNWQQQTLTPAQIHYAASDAVVGYLIYHKLLA